MDLLSDIQAAAVDAGRPLSDLLRKCQILAFRLRHDPFRAWVTHELNGYPNEATLPPYRSSLRGQIKADLSGPFGSGAKNVPVPLTLFPTGIRDEVTEFTFYQVVAMLESLVTDAGRRADSRVLSPFPVEMFARLEIWQRYQTITMWLEVPIASVIGVLDQVRTRALTFTLEIEAENPNAGKASRGDEPPVPKHGLAFQLSHAYLLHCADLCMSQCGGRVPRLGVTARGP